MKAPCDLPLTPGVETVLLQSVTQPHSSEGNQFVGTVGRPAEKQAAEEVWTRSNMDLRKIQGENAVVGERLTSCLRV